MNKLLENRIKRIYIKILSEELFNREDMPQIKGTQFNDAIQALKDLDIKITKEKILPIKLHKSQHEVYPEKVKGIAKDVKENGKKLTPVFISSDNHIVDGHHRKEAQEYLDKDAPINVIRIHLKMNDAIKAFHTVQKQLAGK
jgi:hypothetical protein